MKPPEAKQIRRKEYPAWIFFEVAKISCWKQRPERNTNISYWFYIYTCIPISTRCYSYKAVYKMLGNGLELKTSFDTWLNLLAFCRGELLLTKVCQDTKDESQPQKKRAKTRGKGVFIPWDWQHHFPRKDPEGFVHILPTPSPDADEGDADDSDNSKHLSSPYPVPGTVPWALFLRHHSVFTTRV